MLGKHSLSSDNFLYQHLNKQVNAVNNIKIFQITWHNLSMAFTDHTNPGGAKVFRILKLFRNLCQK